MRMERQEFLGLTGGSVGSLVEALCKTLEQYFYEATSGFYDPVTPPSGRSQQKCIHRDKNILSNTIQHKCPSTVKQISKSWYISIGQWWKYTNCMLTPAWMVLFIISEKESPTQKSTCA